MAQDYPKAMYGTSGQYQTAQDEKTEQDLRSQGFVDGNEWSQKQGQNNPNASVNDPSVPATNATDAMTKQNQQKQQATSKKSE